MALEMLFLEFFFAEDFRDAAAASSAVKTSVMSPGLSASKLGIFNDIWPVLEIV